MECNSTRHVQSEDNETSQSTSICLRTPLILRKVMEHFSNKELLQYSVVNKQWNYEARSLMRLRGAFVARLSSPRTCRQLLNFASLVQQMNVVPFSGMAIHICETDFQEHRQRRGPTSRAAMESAYNVILDRLQWKYFALSLHQEWMRCSKWNCQAFLLAKQILLDFSGVFQVLELYPPRSPAISIEPIFQHYTFPRLTSLKIQSLVVPLDEAQKQFIKLFVARAPNLKELCLKGPVDLSENLLEGSSAVLVVDCPTDPLSAICDDLVCRLKLKQMKLKAIRRNFTVERLDRILPEVLQTSRTALKSLKLNLELLIKFGCYGICLESVTDLQLFVNVEHLSYLPPRMLGLHMDFDFTRIFPSLKKVAVHPCDGHFSYIDNSEIVEQGKAAWKEPPPDRADNIKHVSFTNLSTVSDFFAFMFPETEVLTVTLVKGPNLNYESIWEYWDELKEFHILIQKSFFKRLRLEDEQRSGCENVDSFFCGIHPEEVAELREQDEEYLKTVNIVPTMPSITCLPWLTILRISLLGVGCFTGKNDPTFIFSKVTGLIAFARCPNLTVTIDTHLEWENALSHMKDYASLVYH